MPDEREDPHEGLTPPGPTWVVDDWDRQTGRWLYPSQRQLEEFRREVAKARSLRLSREAPL